MRETEWAPDWTQEETKKSHLLVKGAIAAGLLEVVLLTTIGWHEHWLAHPQKTSDEVRFIEAQIFEMPPQSQLVDEKKPAQAPQKTEQTINKTLTNTNSLPQTQPSDEENKTVSGPKFTPTHGPVAVFAPPPILPSYLQDKELKTQVLIDFYVNNQGTSTARLAGSSGNEELDALALESVKKWIFRPAEKEGKPIEAKVRLTIRFVIE